MARQNTSRLALGLGTPEEGSESSSGEECGAGFCPEAAPNPSMDAGMERAGPAVHSLAGTEDFYQECTFSFSTGGREAAECQVLVRAETEGKR